MSGISGIIRNRTSDRWVCLRCGRHADTGHGQQPPGWGRSRVLVDGREQPGEPLCPTHADARGAT